jgi:hypothetical protein
MSTEIRRPNGDAVAAFVAAGIGCLMLGVLTTAAEASQGLKDALNLYAPVGPLSGKTIGAVVVWLIAWGLLHRMWSGGNQPLKKWLNVTWVLLLLGLLLTFPPVFTLAHSG